MKKRSRSSAFFVNLYTGNSASKSYINIFFVYTLTTTKNLDRVVEVFMFFCKNISTVPTFRQNQELP